MVGSFVRLIAYSTACSTRTVNDSLLGPADPSLLSRAYHVFNIEPHAGSRVSTVARALARLTCLPGGGGMERPCNEGPREDQQIHAMRDELKYQLRLTLRDPFADAVRNHPDKP